eukprot:504770-Rhodomonas_salina.1
MTRFAGSDVILFEGNKAAGAGGAIYTECHQLGQACSVFLGQKLGISPSRNDTRLLFEGNAAEAYGDNVATGPRRMGVEGAGARYVPGRDSLNVTLKFLDDLGQTVRGSATYPNPYVVAVSVSSESPAVQLQPRTFFSTAVDGMLSTLSTPQLLQVCTLADDDLVLTTAIVGDRFREVAELRALVPGLCQECQPGQSRLHETENGVTFWQCLQCEVIQYVVDENDPEHTCNECPVGLRCRGDNVVDPVVPGSAWSVNAYGIYILDSCTLPVWICCGEWWSEVQRRAAAVCSVRKGRGLHQPSMHQLLALRPGPLQGSGRHSQLQRMPARLVPIRAGSHGPGP